MNLHTHSFCYAMNRRKTERVPNRSVFLVHVFSYASDYGFQVKYIRTFLKKSFAQSFIELS